MNEPDDRPTSSDRPGPYGAPPDQPRVPPAPAGPPGDPAGEPRESSSAPLLPPGRSDPGPEARWEDVVDPEVEAPAGPPFGEWPQPGTVRRPPTPPRSAPVSAAPATTATVADDDYDDEEEFDDAPGSRWASLLATVGTALIGIVTVQVLASLVEGLTLKPNQRVGVPDDLLHRLGYPFGGLGATALVFLVLGVVLVSMPSVLDELVSESQERVVGVALVVAIAMGVIIAIGSLLAVRANLHEYAEKGIAVPSYVRVQFTNFLLGSLGAAALALFGAIASMNERSRERFD